MSLKKMLGIISVVIIVVFSMMLTTSYAWYAFENASTSFKGMTNNEDIIISYQTGEYIDTTVAIPISADEVAEYADKNNFNINVKNNTGDMEIMVEVSLVDITIDTVLRNANFLVDLYYQGEKWGTLVGNTIGTSGTTSKTFEHSTTKETAIVLDNDVANMFEIRVYLLDDGSNQNALMNKSFQAKIQVDVVSRLKHSVDDYADPDIYVSAITIDGVESNSLPTSGYYSMEATCDKGSQLEWNSLSKTITYTSGSYVNDDCSLVFTTSTDYPLLSEMPVGSFVKYVGNNGCEGKACAGQNANYVDDISNKGYCGNADYKFYESGWRIGYIENGSAYLISAGAPECEKHYVDYDTYIDSLNNTALKYCNSDYVNGGVCNVDAVWAMNNNDFQKITGSDFYGCYLSVSDFSCGYNNNLIDIGGQYWFAAFSSSTSNLLTYRSVAPKYTVKPLAVITNGVRPVIFLDSSVTVIDGDGTYENPYIIVN